MKGPVKYSWFKVSIVVSGVLVTAGFASSIFLGAYADIFSRPDNIDALAIEHNGLCVSKYFQDSTPSLNDITAGTKALKKWKTATDIQRRQLIVDILVGNSLIGLSYDDVENYFGKCTIAQPGRMEYSVPYLDTVFEHGLPSGCTLILELGSEEEVPLVNKAYIEAEY